MTNKSTSPDLATKNLTNSSELLSPPTLENASPPPSPPPPSARKKEAQALEQHLPSPHQIQVEKSRRHLLPFVQLTKPDYIADRFHVESMRDPSMAREAGRIYESLRGAELKSQAQRLVTRLPDTRIESLVQSAGLPEKYAQALVGRRGARDNAPEPSARGKVRERKALSLMSYDAPRS